MDSNLTLLLILTGILLFVIAAIRRRLVFEVQAASMLLFGKARVGIYIYSLIFLPGTILHELSHWIVAEILQVPTGKFTVLPDFESDTKGEERLGYVMTGRSDPLRGFLIGFAPLFTGILALILLGYALESLRVSGAVWWQIALVIYGLIVVGNSMIVSSADRHQWPIMAILLIVVGMIFYYLGLTLSSIILNLASAILTQVNIALGLTIGLNLAMICGSFAIRRGLEYVTKKRIVRGRQ